ncbi:hypothetical protein SMACR_00584 [Sordaria macrospora]|uniref:Uncharacterized protein n=1 Tax=Sordaria macrospora TaxID=5147 RepID=A0A8S8ZI84_SORMA|nr:hypothetical protein SMACR_00584 [Sordaria macrospora]KAH7627442.1 hypothetical protein B0T09DRAFT_359780 [Sordaria sp. MPI-SDFR-AT-0083]WPJ59335.1 hypothetical protein SMAC4_00584 [Sordaria macrospora]
MSSFLWPSDFRAYKYRLSLATIADAMNIADCAFVRISSLLKENDEAHNHNATFSLDVADGITKDVEPTNAAQEITNVNPTPPASVVEELALTILIADGRDDSSISSSDTETRVYSHVTPITDIFKDEPTSSITNLHDNPSTFSSEVHAYYHSASLVDFVEINTTSATRSNVAEPVDDHGVFVGSVDYNEFKRFLDQDRMWGIHRPATYKPLIRSSKAAQKKNVLPIVKSDEKKEKKVAASHIVSTIINAPEGAADAPACTSSDVQKPDDITSERVRKLSTDKLAVDSNYGIPTKAQLPPFSSVYDYGYINFTQEYLKDLWIMTVLQQPGYPFRYARFNCGFWYILEDRKNVRMMVEQEYQEFVQWISNNTATVAILAKAPEVNPNSRPKHLSPKWTPRPAD